MKLKRLPPLPKVTELHRDNRGQGMWTVVSVNKRTKVRKTTWTEAGEHGIIVREEWTCDHLPGQTFQSYDALRAHYNGDTK